jgi:hypothetical protein
LLRTETKDNIIASFIDIASILFAYNIGVSQLGLFAGLLYSGFDAWIVVWQRQRISYIARKVGYAIRSKVLKQRDVLPWITN